MSESVTGDRPSSQTLSALLQRGTNPTTWPSTCSISPSRTPRQPTRLSLASFAVARSPAGSMRVSSGCYATLRMIPRENHRLASGLFGFSFVESRKDGSIVYHDSTREMLLRQWRTEDSVGGTEFTAINDRLIAFYLNELEAAKQAGGELNHVAPVVQHANPTRYTQLVSTVRDRVTQPLLEALYHSMLASPDVGFDFFQWQYEHFEQRGWSIMCSALVHGALANLKQLWPEPPQDKQARWLRYYQARLSASLRQYADAEERLKALLPETEGDVKLKLWALTELGDALRGQMKLREAGGFYEAELQLAEQSRFDPYNLAVSYLRVGGLHDQIGQVDEAEQRFRQALEAAQETGNSELETSARVQLSGVLQARGDWEGALELTLRALEYVRTNNDRSPTLRQNLAAQFMSLFGRREPMLLDTAFQSAEALLYVLMTDMGDPFVSLEHERLYIEQLHNGGQRTRAWQRLTQFSANALKHPEAEFDSEVLFLTAALYEGMGETGLAIEQYDKLLADVERGAAGAWERAASLSNRGWQFALRGELQVARAALQSSIDIWRGMGQDILADFVTVWLADVERRAARYSEAEQLLAAAGMRLKPLATHHTVEYCSTLGDLRRDQGRWSDAQAAYTEALTISRRLYLADSTASLLGKSAELAFERSDWEAAASCTTEAAELWRELATRERYRPTPQIEEAERDNAEGMRLFSLSEGRRGTGTRARDLFRAAVDRVPANLIYLQNLTYACIELDEWGEAADAVQSILERSPDWLRARILYERLAEYRLRQAQDLIVDGANDEAARLLSHTRSRLDEHVAPETSAALSRGLGDALLEVNRTGAAREEFEAGLALSSGQERAALLVRLALVTVLEHDLQAGIGHLRAALDLLADVESDPAQALMKLAEPLLRTQPRFAAFGNAVRCLAQQHAVPAQRADLLTAWLDLVGRRTAQRLVQLPDGTRTRAEVPGQTADVVRVVLAVSRGLSTTVEYNRETPVLSEELRTMRGRIQARTGVAVPEVSVRFDDSLPSGAYAISVDEIPVAFGQLEVNSETLVNARQSLIGRLETVLLLELPAFVGVDEVGIRIIDTDAELPAKDDRTAEHSDSIWDEVETRIELVRSVQELVRDGVGIDRLDVAVKAFAGGVAEGAPRETVRERMRAALHADLPGADGERPLLRISDAIEATINQGILNRGGKRFLCLRREQAEAIVAELRALVATSGPEPIALLVHSPDLRPFMQRFVEQALPGVPVVAETEVSGS